jgi:hypothetical protein
LLRQAQRIVNLDPEIADRALNLRMCEKQLDRSEIASLAVDLRRFGATHRMRAEGRVVHPGALNPAMHDAGVLAGGDMRLIVDAARKDLKASICRARIQPVLQRTPGLFRDLELNRTAGLVLDDRCSISHATAGGDVVDPKAEEIAAAQLAVDGEIEHRQIAFATLNLKSDPNGPDLFRPKGTLLANETAFVPYDARRRAVYFDFGGHGRSPRPTAPTAASAFSRPATVSQSHRDFGDLVP